MPKKSKSSGWHPDGTSIQKVTPLADGEKCTLLLFYHYCRPPLSEGGKRSLEAWLRDVACRLNLGGRIRVATEGLNSTISGTAEATRAFSESLKAWAPPEGKEKPPPFADCAQFKFVDDLPSDRAFCEVKIIPVKELVFYGVDESSAPLSSGALVGVNLLFCA